MLLALSLALVNATSCITASCTVRSTSKCHGTRCTRRSDGTAARPLQIVEPEAPIVSSVGGRPLRAVVVHPQVEGRPGRADQGLGRVLVAPAGEGAAAIPLLGGDHGGCVGQDDGADVGDGVRAALRVKGC